MNPQTAATRHHPVFYRFQPFRGAIPDGCGFDFLGSKIRTDFWYAPLRNPGYPAIDAKYFEWIALLESVVESRDSYSMIELGAGFGIWSVRAALAMAQSAAIPVHLTVVEADPVHFEWIKLHFEENGIDFRRHRLIRAAVSAPGTDWPFLVGSPAGARPNEWYGQALCGWAGEIVDPCADFYGGFPARLHASGWRSIDMPKISLREILDGSGRVDLIHLDVQGVELEVIESAIDALSAKVQRLCIATHSRQIDQKLARTLGEHGWKCAMAYPCGETSETPWGSVAFEDGLQIWINPPRIIGYSGKTR